MYSDRGRHEAAGWRVAADLQHSGGARWLLPGCPFQQSHFFWYALLVQFILCFTPNKYLFFQVVMLRVVVVSYSIGLSSTDSVMGNIDKFIYSVPEK